MAISGKAIAALACTALTATAVGAASNPTRFSLTATQVAAALDWRGILASPDQVALLADVVAARPNPVLEVRSLARWDGLHSRVELACRDGRDCLPFYVLVAWPTKAAAQGALDAFGGGVGPGGAPSPANSTLPGLNSTSRDAPPRPPASGKTGPTVLKAGAHATLILDGDKMHILVAVVCLESGQAGRKIRVQSEDRKQTYIAEVVDGGYLKGSL